MNIAQLPAQEIERFGEHAAIIFGEYQYTNIDMRRASLRLANALRELGVGRGDRVIIQMPNCPEVLQSFMAVYSLGAVVVPINFMVGEAETAFIYRDTGAVVIISSSAYLPKIEACRKHASSIRHVILIDREVPRGVHSWHTLCDGQPDYIDIEPVDPDDLAALIYTAGTTGEPKGVMHTHGTLLANAEMQKATLNLDPGFTTVLVLPLCHSYGIAGMNFGMLVGGVCSVVLDSFDVEKIFASIETYKANIIGAVPTLYVFMLLKPELKKYDLTSMKYWISGSAPLTLETWERFRDYYGFEIIEGWGLTEAGANNSVNPLKGKKKVGSIGLPMKGTLMKVVDEDNNEMPDGAQGEIIISGPMLMKGYWQKPEETAKVIRDGWLCTGDIGYRDSEGYYFITERKKDIIIKGGENIAPREIEEVIYRHPAVSEAAVIGIPDEVYGEDIKAFVVLKPNEKATEDEIIEHCRQKLKNFKSPKKVAFLEAMPKSLVGKILRKELRKI